MSSEARDRHDLERELRDRADPEAAQALQRFFKTGPGEYGEGDRFLGIRVPDLRRIARRYHELTMTEVKELLRSPDHEARFVALLLLIQKYERGEPEERDAIHRLYLAETGHVNSWDLVDLSAPMLVGRHLESRDRSLLQHLAESSSVWERRIAVLATFHFIRNEEYEDTFAVADRLLEDPHDLIHKAVGWMLREVGKRDLERLEAYLRPRYSRMPRTMLRYAIERFEPEARRRYLEGTV